MTLHFFVASSQKDVDMLLMCNVKNILVSYAYISKGKFQMSLQDISTKFEHVFVDSGAYTAHSLGMDIDIDEYLDYLKANKDYIFTAAQLDSIGNVKETVDNYRYMKENGCDWVSPVLQGMFVNCLYHMKQVGITTDYVHIGDNGWYTERGLDAEEKVHGLSRNYKYHGLARAGEASWRRGFYYSTDSSSWLAAAQYGQAESYLKGIRSMISVGHSNRREDVLQTTRILNMSKEDLRACQINDDDVRAVDRDTLSRMNIALFYRPLMRHLKIFDKNFYS